MSLSNSVVYQRDAVLACRVQVPLLFSDQDRPLPEDPLDAELISAFECPFQMYCELTPCPFGHSPTSQAQETDTDDQVIALRPIPWYFCMDRLLDQCESVVLERINNQLVRCEFGFHPTNEDLIEPDQFTAQLATAVLAFKSLTPIIHRKAPQCVCCFKTIASGMCAMMENCPHRFCGECIATHFEVIRPHMSSVCRACGVASSRIMLWPQPICSRAYQQYLFTIQKRAFGLLVCGQSHVAVHEPVNANQVVVYYKGTLTESKIAAYQLENRSLQTSNSRHHIPSTDACCVICLKSIAASVDRLWAYLENCGHRFCLRCIMTWRTEQAPIDPWTGLKRIDFACPTCRASSGRILVWPEPMVSQTFQHSLFVAQKMCLGLWVNPDCVVSIHEDRATAQLAFICNGQVWIPQDATNSTSASYSS